MTVLPATGSGIPVQTCSLAVSQPRAAKERAPQHVYFFDVPVARPHAADFAAAVARPPSDDFAVTVALPPAGDDDFAAPVARPPADDDGRKRPQWKMHVSRLT